MNDTKITTRKQWVQTDGWRGYEEPIYWVAGANDTGDYYDSPCPSGKATEELKSVKSILRENKIRYREVATNSSNVFCLKRYIIVSPADIEKAKQVVGGKYDEELKQATDLLYVNR